VALLGCAACANQGAGNLEARLAVHDSATFVLTGICADSHPGEHPPIRADQVKGEASPDARDPLARLALRAGERTELRHVRLTCDGVTLSEAWNWYVPARLPDEVNEQLSGSDIPFGRALAPHRFTRGRLWSRHGRAGACPVGTVLSQAAVLRLPGQQEPVSYVLECYTRAALHAGGEPGGSKSAS